MRLIDLVDALVVGGLVGALIVTLVWAVMVAIPWAVSRYPRRR